MNSGDKSVTTVKKEMGITHNDFYAGLPALLNKTPYQQNEDTIRFLFNGKYIEITLGAEGIRKIGPTVRLPVTLVTMHFFDFSEEEASRFIRHFDLKFMKGGG